MRCLLRGLLRVPLSRLRTLRSSNASDANKSELQGINRTLGEELNVCKILLSLVKSSSLCFLAASEDSQAWPVRRTALRTCAQLGTDMPALTTRTVPRSREQPDHHHRPQIGHVLQDRIHVQDAVV